LGSELGDKKPFLPDVKKLKKLIKIIWKNLVMMLKKE
jgi:hypothetical protein